MTAQKMPLARWSPARPTCEIVRVRDIDMSVVRLHEHGIDRGISTGFVQLDRLYRIRRGEWTVLTGIPGHGKSTFLDNVIVKTAQNEGWKWGIFSAENQPVERHLAGLAEITTGEPFRTGPAPRMSQNTLAATFPFLDFRVFFICPSDEHRTPAHILKLAEDLVDLEGIDALIIDPWNELDHRRPANLSETEYVSRSLSMIRSFARNHEVHVFVVAHPTKMQKQPDKSYAVPTPYDVSGSAHWRNKADCALTVWRDLSANANEVEVHVQKIRFREVGQLGTALVKYDRVSGRYS